MKISIITATYNSMPHVVKAFESIKCQDYENIEHIIVDGGSTDGTIEFLKKNALTNSRIISEPDHGIYDALNKGISIATGDIIGFLHSDDYFVDPYCVSEVVRSFVCQKCKVLYANLNYVDPSNYGVVRKWTAGKYSRLNVMAGWMPPHPTFYVLKHLYCDNQFNLKYKISADYDSMLSIISLAEDSIYFLNKTIVHMSTGGVSNKGLSNIMLKMSEDLAIIKQHHLLGVATLALKNLRKIPQFIG